VNAETLRTSKNLPRPDLRPYHLHHLTSLNHPTCISIRNSLLNRSVGRKFGIFSSASASFVVVVVAFSSKRRDQNQDPFRGASTQPVVVRLQPAAPFYFQLIFRKFSTTINTSQKSCDFQPFFLNIIVRLLFFFELQ